MDEQTARSLARDVIGPCGLLGYVVGRGTWWPSDEASTRGKRAAAHVMADAYCLLAPLWQTYVALDPGRGSDPLDLASRSTALRDTPSDLRSLLGDVESAARRAAPFLHEYFPESSARVRRDAAALEASIREARHVLDQVAPA